MMLRTILAAVCVMAFAMGAHAKRLPKMTNSVGMTLVKIPAGSFMMGDESCKNVLRMCDDPFDRTKRAPCKDGAKILKCDGDENERPVHHVTLTKSFWIMTTEVTQRQYYEVMGENPSEFTSDKLGHRSENNPVETVSWYDAVNFANKLSDKEGLSRCYSASGDEVRWDKSCKGYRLPTEAEWEYTARAGTKSNLPNGNIVTPLGIDTKADQIAWYNRNSGNLARARIEDPDAGGPYDLTCAKCGNTTHAVRGKTPNPWGLFDMNGNVFEWVWDYLGAYSGDNVDPTGAPSGSLRIKRGGSWNDLPFYIRSAVRRAGTPTDGYSNLGFRLVRTTK